MLKRSLAALTLAFVVPVTALPAQSADRGDRFAPADQALASGDTVGAIELLRRVAEQRLDAEAWHRRGTLALRLLPKWWERPVVIDESTPGHEHWVAVETSLRNATRLAPDSARYWLTLAGFQLHMRSGEAHHAGFESIDRALGAARRVGGAEAMGIAAYDAAMLFWSTWLWIGRRPEHQLEWWEKRALAVDDSTPVPLARHYRVVDRGREERGDKALTQATYLLDVAADSAPAISLHRRRRYAALASREAWEELDALAARRARLPDADAIDLLALGLARHRLVRPAAADSAFTRARAIMSPAARHRLTSLARILPDHEAMALHRFTGDAREQAEQRSWLLVDPLWIVPGNELRNEFLARVAFAELRWADGSVDGPDTDAGRLWLAYGPPRFTVTHLGRVNEAAYHTWLWANGVRVSLMVQRRAVSEQLQPLAREGVDRLLRARGTNWNEVPGMRGIDTVDVQTARFRATPDSADLFVAARVPTHRLAPGADARAALALHFWLRTPDGDVVVRDSAQWPVDAGMRRAPAMRVWRRRIANGSYIHRVEVAEPVQGRAARGYDTAPTIDDVRFPLAGFGVSDVLVVDRAAARDGGAADARWSDYNIVPSPGDLQRRRPVSLLWEVYGGGTTALEAYRVEVTLQRPGAPAPTTLAERATSGVVGERVQRVKSKDRVTLTYTRRHPTAAQIRVEHVSLGVVDVDPGEYILRIDVVDEATRKRATTSRLVKVR